MTSLLDCLCPCRHALLVRVPSGNALFFPTRLTKQKKRPRTGAATLRPSAASAPGFRLARRGGRRAKDRNQAVVQPHGEMAAGGGKSHGARQADRSEERRVGKE